MNRREFLGASALTAATPFLPAAAAEKVDYPAGAMRAIAMFGPGSGADVKIRFYAAKLGEKLGRAIIVENRVGAMGNIATEAAVRARPDGLTLYIAPGSSMLAAAPHLFKKLNYDPVKDFEHITTLNYSAFTLCVDAKSPFHKLDDLTKYLREKGEDAFYASSAPPSVVASEIYKQNFGLKAVEVKYRAQNAMFNDLFGGRIAYTFIDFISVAAHRKSGRIRTLCMACAERLKSAPDVPGAREAGIKGLDIRNWWSVHVPAKTPKSVCDTLEKLFNEIAVAPDTLKFLELNGSDPMPGNSKMLRELLVKETQDWGRYVNLARIEQQ